MFSPKPSQLCVSWTDRLPTGSGTTSIPSTQLMASFLVKFLCLPSYNFPFIPHQLDFSLHGEERWPWDSIAFYLPITNTYSQGNSYLASSQHHNLNIPANSWIGIRWKLGHGWGGYGSQGCWTKGSKSQRSLWFCCCHCHSFPQVSLFCFHLLYPILLPCLQHQGIKNVSNGFLLQG